MDRNGFTSLTVEKLKRIAKKYGCSFVPKFPTETSLEESSTSKPESEIEETSVLSENKPIQETQKTQKEARHTIKCCATWELGNKHTLLKS